MNKEVKKIYHKHILKLIAAILICPCIVLLAYGLGKIILGQFIWYEDDFIYVLGKWIESKMVMFTTLATIFGGFCVGVFFVRKPFVYLSEVLQATGGLYQNREELIKFPPVLKDAEIS